MNAKHTLCIAALALASSPFAATAPALDLVTLSKSVKPCDDFYAYANEGWLATAQIPPDRSWWGTFAIVRENNETLLKRALAELQSDPAKVKSDAMRKVVDYYASGMDTSSVERAGLTPIQPQLNDIARLKDRKQIPSLLANLHRAGIGPAFSVSIGTDAKDRTRYWPELWQGGLGLPDRDYYIRTGKDSKRIRDEYVKHVARMLELGGANAQDAARGAAVVMKIETTLANASMTLVEQRDPKAVYNKRTLADLRKAVPQFDWNAYFTALSIPVDGELNLANPRFFPVMVRTLSAAPLADVQTYLRWHVLRESAPRLAAALEAEHFRFNGTVLSGKKQQRPREERVMEEMTGRYGDAPLAEALGQIFVERAFSPAAKEKSVTMVRYIREALRERIQQLTWMRDATKQAALKKLDAMVLKVGYPDRWREYGALTVKRDAYAENWLAANRFQFDWRVAKLGKPVDRSEWWMAPHLVNAYAGDFNEIVFPAGILQPPFFDESADDAVNFGAIGMVIGHEITHHFDDQGRQFDEVGNLKEWWTREDTARYKSRAEALVKQYGGYTGASGLRINGRLTLGENIADLGGLTISHLGLRKLLKDKPQAAIDGLTPEQRFFLSYAQSWREKTRIEDEKKQIQTDPHSPPRYRVKGPLANMPAFAEAFNCKPGEGGLRAENERVLIW